VAKIQADRGSNLGREDFAHGPGEAVFDIFIPIML
jgi:hypothetical protein